MGLGADKYQDKMYTNQPAPYPQHFEPAYQNQYIGDFQRQYYNAGYWFSGQYANHSPMPRHEPSPPLSVISPNTSVVSPATSTTHSPTTVPGAMPTPPHPSPGVSPPTSSTNCIPTSSRIDYPQFQHPGGHPARRNFLPAGINPAYFPSSSAPALTPARTRTRDKYRVVYSEHQRMELEKEYRSSRYITIKRKTDLADSLNLSERQIKIWFQNRRAKDRKNDSKKKVRPSAAGTIVAAQDTDQIQQHMQHQLIQQQQQQQQQHQQQQQQQQHLGGSVNHQHEQQQQEQHQNQRYHNPQIMHEQQYIVPEVSLFNLEGFQPPQNISSLMPQQSSNVSAELQHQQQQALAHHQDYPMDHHHSQYPPTLPRAYNSPFPHHDPLFGHEMVEARYQNGLHTGNGFQNMLHNGVPEPIHPHLELIQNNHSAIQVPVSTSAGELKKESKLIVKSEQTE